MLALLVRIQLGWPHAEIPILGDWFCPSNGGRMSPEFYNMLFTMHATVMIFFVIIPLLTGAFGNFTDPADDRRQGHGVPQAEHDVVLVHVAGVHRHPAASFFVEGGGAGGRLDLVSDARQHRHAGRPGLQSPAAPHSGHGQIFWLVALLFVGVSSMMGSVNYITTIINMRAPGMTLFRMPMTIWAMFITAILQAFALPVLTVALILQLLDKTIGTTFFLPPDGLTFGNWHTGARRRPAAPVAAPVLVLFAPGRVHHDPAGDGHGVRHHLRPSPASRCSATGRWSTPSPASPGWASSSGAITCSRAAWTRAWAPAS